ncbi:proteoglycan 4 isoform X2 [Tribolium castaneum]|uniref:Aftiphilin clathrin-binding box domain-containing protein n=1 Tax=Tribolium castaneum TaxID=7070 RepID=D6WPU6_TRICA|nr:hypothetical protein TcasGA2_TC009820 [Tribolium castaneum]
MSNLIPPLLSSSPPPIVGPLDEDDDDEFGDFRAAADSFDCDDFSLPPSPQKSSELKTDLSKVSLDINSNKSQKNTQEMPTENVEDSVVCEEVSKDFQDRRKSLDAEIKVNSSEQIDEINGFEADFNDQKIEDDDFADLQCTLPNETQVENGVNSLSNDENLFEAFSEKTNDISESNEIKSEDYFSEEINDKCENDLSESSVSLKVSESEQKSTEDDFGDFENHFSNDKEASDDEFDDFVEPPQQSKEDDDFGDFESSEFGDFSQSCEKSTLPEIDVKNALEKSEAILKEFFPDIEQDSDDCVAADYTTENRIFDELKDVTETNALVYQWSKSNSQKMFLKSLNIDTRNILYGPAWNGSMPRFAGLTPLEPVKTEILTPTPVQNVSSPSSNSSQKEISDIPTVQFDWNGSGLINPLDSTSTELSANVPEETTQSQNSDFLPPVSSRPDLFEPELQVSKENEKTDFSPFHSPKLIPLRETHISNEQTDLSKPGWLQPTILTPDLPRKEPVIAEPEDEFDDFQMVLPEENKNLPDLSEFETTKTNSQHISASETSGPAAEEVIEEDEFTEFHASLPVESLQSVQPEPLKPVQPELPKSVLPLESLKPLQPEPLKPVLPAEPFKPVQPEPLKPVLPAEPFKPVQPEPLKPVLPMEPFKPVQPEPLKPVLPLEPLKPLPVEPLKPVPVEPLKPSSTLMTQINWPEPGVTDEDIRNIELTYSRKEEKPEISKGKSLDDDEWSDFVSVTNPVMKPVMPDRTATPDLPLSVLNLNSVQAPKQPIPVITPSGLVQTKLSSNMPKSVVQTSVQPMFRPPMNQFQPSIISNQFAANFPGASQDDDDDWSDFVSSQPPPQVNGYQKAAPTNIIMNPTHFETLNYTAPKNKISTIPDLDFIAPKNRTKK